MKISFSHLEQFRDIKGPRGTDEGDRFGVFWIPRGKEQFCVIASSGSQEITWEHVSARCRDHKGERCPNWEEMCWLKELFWDDTECVVQFHPPKEDYVNCHKHVLHLWKPTDLEMPRPPLIAV